MTGVTTTQEYLLGLLMEVDMTTILTIALVAMSLVAFTAIGYGFYIIHKINSYEYRQTEAYKFLAEERRKVGLA